MEQAPQLEIGNEVYFCNDSLFRIYKVEKVTPTQAVLNSGDRIKRQSKWSTWNSIHGWAFAEIGGGKWNEYQLVNDDIREKSKQMRRKIKINNWFSSHRFTDEQKEQIYNLINPTLQGE